jgi:hypothetical protein
MISQSDQPPTAPAAYYHQKSQNPRHQQHQHHHQQQQQQQHLQYHQQHQHQQMDAHQQAAAAAAWGNYYGWSVTDYNNAYATNYTAEQYQQYIQQYYQSQDPNNYYGYYDASYYQQQPQAHQEIPQQPEQATNTSTVAQLQPQQLATPAVSTNNTDQSQSMMGGVPESTLDEVGYPYQTSEDPSILFEKIGQVGEGTYG